MNNPAKSDVCLPISSIIPLLLCRPPKTKDSLWKCHTLANKTDQSIPSSLFVDTYQHIGTPILIRVGDFHRSENIEVILTPDQMERAGRITQNSTMERRSGSLGSISEGTSNSGILSDPLIPVCTIWTDLRNIPEILPPEKLIHELEDLSRYVVYNLVCFREANRTRISIELSEK